MNPRPRPSPKRKRRSLVAHLRSLARAGLRVRPLRDSAPPPLDLNAPRQTRANWRLIVPASGPVKLPREVLEAAQAWEGDVLAVSVRQSPTHREIVLRILPHGLTPAQIARAERRILRAIKRDRKAGKLVPFTVKAQTKRNLASALMAARGIMSGPRDLSSGKQHRRAWGRNRKAK